MIPILDRINVLARKQRAEGLTEGEKREQQQLRKEYLQIFRGQLVQTFSEMTILDPLGNDITPEKLRREQEKQRLIKNDDV